MITPHRSNVWLIGPENALTVRESDRENELLLSVTSTSGAGGRGVVGVSVGVGVGVAVGVAGGGRGVPEKTRYVASQEARADVNFILM
jgi:hypothetical protein